MIVLDCYQHNLIMSESVSPTGICMAEHEFYLEINARSFPSFPASSCLWSCFHLKRRVNMIKVFTYTDCAEMYGMKDLKKRVLISLPSLLRTSSWFGCVVDSQSGYTWYAEADMKLLDCNEMMNRSFSACWYTMGSSATVDSIRIECKWHIIIIEYWCSSAPLHE